MSQLGHVAKTARKNKLLSSNNRLTEPGGYGGSPAAAFSNAAQYMSARRLGWKSQFFGSESQDRDDRYALSHEATKRFSGGSC